jgi:ribosomal protein L39E
MPIKNQQKKSTLAKHGRRTKWAPVWAVLKKFGTGKRVHPSAITHVKRSWKRNKLKVKPRKDRPKHYG